MQYLLFSLINIWCVNYSPNDILKIELNVSGIEVVSMSNEYFLNGELIFHNKSSNPLKLPKTFDLEIILTDSLGNTVPKNSQYITEYHNLILSKKAFVIDPFGKLKIEFSEWRLFLYELKIRRKYFLKYILDSTNQNELSEALNQQKIESNKVSFVFK